MSGRMGVSTDQLTQSWLESFFDMANIECDCPWGHNPKYGDEEDVPDDWVTCMTYDTVKLVVLQLLYGVTEDIRHEDCFGCQMGLPSQREHPCLEDKEENFYTTFSGS